MRALIGLFMITSLTATGCLFAEKKPNGVERREHRACEPAHHWEGGDCVHNGNKYKTKSNKHAQD
jgi:hypothetical protein